MHIDDSLPAALEQGIPGVFHFVCGIDEDRGQMADGRVAESGCQGFTLPDVFVSKKTEVE